jgi:hypothetical protein
VLFIRWRVGAERRGANDAMKASEFRMEPIAPRSLKFN